MSRLSVLCCCLVLALAGSLVAHALSIRLVAGSGYVFRDNDMAVAIDALTSYGTTADMQETMRTGASPYDLDVILVTHSDIDHFDASLVAANMLTQTASLLVGPSDVIEPVRALLPDLASERFMDVTSQSCQPIAEVPDNLLIMPLSFPHPPNESRANLGYLLTIGSITLLHPGDLDVDAAADRFEEYELPQRGIDLVFLPSFILSDTGLVDAIDNLGAEYLIPTHASPRNLTGACRQASLLFTNLLCFPQLSEEIEYTAASVDEGAP